MFVNSDNYIKYLKSWLITLFLLVVSMVAVGGLTRLTDSGLSITAWELFTGILPPLNIIDWNNYFSEYKKIPEYQNINFDMTLSEFKVIFYWEYAHRLLARIVGLFSLIPLVFFSLKFNNHKFYSNKYYLIFLLICLQGFIGWYMVWYLLDISNINKFKIKVSNSLLLLILTLIILQIILGAFLSGLDGGLIYNSWPDMNGSFFPNDVNIKDYLSYKLLYNPSIIQFYHRTTAYLLLCFIIALNYLFFKKKLNYKCILIFDFAILLQIFLGIITLVSGVEIRYASLHQLGSIFVLSTYLLILYKNTSQQL